MKYIEDMKTTKSNLEYHGFGIENIRKCVEKYGGQLNYEYQDDKIVATTILFDASEER